ncbi:MAG: flippase-like domain-containing protein [bacterium]|nr:flippase-like domain-containing protein [bacterium]
MERTQLKKYLKTFGKLIVAFLGCYVVHTRIEITELLGHLNNANPVWLLIAATLFIVSQIASSYRLNVYLKHIGFGLSELSNLKLYSKGMFYNLFLPGGIGGDGYKVFYLNSLKGISTKSIVSALINDRLSGLLALMVLGFMFGWQTSFVEIIGQHYYLLLCSIAPISLFGMLRVFATFRSSLHKTFIISLLVQGFQVVSALCIIQALGIAGLHMEYVFLFLVSSVASVIPISIGGLGLRELAFILGAQYLRIDQEAAVALSLIFFSISALVSLLGIFVRIDESKSENSLLSS